MRKSPYKKRKRTHNFYSNDQHSVTMALYIGFRHWFHTAVHVAFALWRLLWFRTQYHFENPKYPDPTTIFNIPEELFLLVYARLRVADRVCLVLTCRRLYCKLGSEALSHPDLTLLIDNGLVKYENGFPPRTELLRRLERDNHHEWRYCVGCHILHKPSTFSKGIDYPKYSPRLFTYRICGMAKVLQTQVIKICSCIQISPRDKLSLIEYLKTISQDGPITFSKTEMKGRLRTLFQLDTCGYDGIARLRHTCLVVDHPRAKILLSIKASLGDGDRLVVHSEYLSSASGTQLPEVEFLVTRPSEMVHNPPQPSTEDDMQTLFEIWEAFRTWHDKRNIPLLTNGQYTCDLGNDDGLPSIWREGNVFRHYPI